MSLIYGILRQALNYNVTIIEHDTADEVNEKVMMGFSDISLISYSQLHMSNSLHPSGKLVQSLWVKNVQLKSSPLFFTEPFTVNLWFTFGAAFLIYFLVSALIKRLNIKRQISWNILLITFLTLAFAFEATFNAFLSGFLAFRTVDLPFRNLEELLLRPDYILCLRYFGLARREIEYEKMMGKRIDVEIDSPHCPVYDRLYMSNHNMSLTDRCDYPKIAFIETIEDINFEKM